MHLNKARIEVLHVLVLAAAVLTQRHDVADKLVRCDYRDLDIRLIGLGDRGHIRIIMGIVDQNRAAVSLDDLVYDGGQSRHEVEVKLALQTLLNDLHMQHSEKAAAEAETKRDRAFRLVGKGGVV